MAEKSTPRKLTPADSIRCKHTNAAGRQCTALRVAGKYGLCTVHATEDRQLREAEEVARELLGATPDLNTTVAVNHVLAKLFKLIAANRIPPRNAALLAYVDQLLLSSLDNVRYEMKRVEGDEFWDGTVSRALELLKT